MQRGVAMKNITGKLFQNIQSREVSAFEYVNSNDYYSFVDSVQKQGYVQAIFTSDIMLKTIEYYLFTHNAQIISIEFFVDDFVLQNEIDIILHKMSSNPAFWEMLKQKLIFLCEDNYIDIRKVDIKCSDDAYLLSVMVNGLFSVTSSAYPAVSAELCRLMGDYIK